MQSLTIVRVDSERQLAGSWCCSAPRVLTIVRPAVKAKGDMELKVLNHASGSCCALMCFSVATSARFIRSWLPSGNARSGDRQQKDRSGSLSIHTTKPWRQKGTGRARAGSTGSLLWRGGGRIFSELAGREFQPEGQQEDVSCRYGIDPFRSWLVRIACWSSMTVDRCT